EKGIYAPESVSSQVDRRLNSFASDQTLVDIPIPALGTTGAFPQYLQEGFDHWLINNNEGRLSLRDPSKSLDGIGQVADTRRVARRSEQARLVGENGARPKPVALHDESLHLFKSIMSDDQVGGALAGNIKNVLRRDLHLHAITGLLFEVG